MYASAQKPKPDVNQIISNHPGLLEPLLTMYSKLKLKSNGDKASPYFKTFLVGNTPTQCLPTCTLP